MNISLRHTSVVTQGRTLLQAIDLTLSPGEMVGVIGPNGAGKSTLVNLLAGTQAAATGRVQFTDSASSELTSQWLAQTRPRHLAVLPQQAGLDFPFTVAEVVAMGRIPYGLDGARLSQETRQRVNDVIDALALGELRDRVYTTLSGGERQRTQIARVLCQLWQQPQAWYLLDEPVAALDIAQQLRVLELFAGLAKAGAGMLLVMHDMNLAARYCDRLLLLKHGRIIADGTPDVVLTRDNLHSAFGVIPEIVVLADGRRQLAFTRAQGIAGAAGRS